MIARNITSKLNALLDKFPAVTLTGPRQSGKTTLIREVFKDLPYASLETPDLREVALQDPKGFLANYPKGAVFDEIQRAPKLFSYLQGIIDENPSVKFVLSGSQNFLLLESISQSLAGRVAILHLLPFSIKELKTEGLLSTSLEEVAFKGFFPRIFDKDIDPLVFYPNYLQTYVERDVRQIKQIGDLNSFNLFLRLCAGRAGQLLNLSDLSNNTGISVNTVKSWLSVLEASFILFRLQPHHQNFNKRLTKMPKIYFYDTGFLCNLLGINEPDQIRTHHLRGPIFENLVIAEITKQYYNRGQLPRISFWRDHKGNEVDLLVEENQTIYPIEIKASASMSSIFFKGLNHWNKLSGGSPENSYVIYAGKSELKGSQGNFQNWSSLDISGF